MLQRPEISTGKCLGVSQPYLQLLLVLLPSLARSTIWRQLPQRRLLPDRQSSTLLFTPSLMICSPLQAQVSQASKDTPTLPPCLVEVLTVTHFLCTGLCQQGAATVKV